jgi:hypothetical protein
MPMLRRLALLGSTAFIALGGSSCEKSSRTSAFGAPSMHFTVALQGPGSGRVQSRPAGIDCPGACAATFPAGDSIVFSATPSAGSIFQGWSGACSGFDACHVSDSAALSAAFAPLAASLRLVAVGAQLPNIRLDSNPVRIFIRQWIKFDARINGLSLPRVAWSLREGRDAGAVARDGTYSAPEKVGLYHLTATGLDDPRLEGSIAIEVVATQDLYDYGGAILPKPKVQLVWWGTPQEFLGAVENFHGFLKGVNGSQWLGVLDEYLRGDTAEVSLAGEIFDATPRPLGPIPAPGARICRILEQYRMEPDPGTIYALMVATSTGQFDYHSTANCRGKSVPMIVLALPPANEARDGACSPVLSPAEKMLFAFSHELAETITDPQPATGWTDIYGQEIADNCTQGTCAQLATGSYSLSTLFSNAAHGCAP